jgi:hypothetical protein
MKRLNQLTKEINQLTIYIEENYPELYRHLDENPITITNEGTEPMTTKNFSDYLDNLKQVMEHYVQQQS